MFLLALCGIAYVVWIKYRNMHLVQQDVQISSFTHHKVEHEIELQSSGRKQSVQGSFSSRNSKRQKADSMKMSSARGKQTQYKTSEMRLEDYNDEMPNWGSPRVDTQENDPPPRLQLISMAQPTLVLVHKKVFDEHELSIRKFN